MSADYYAKRQARIDRLRARAAGRHAAAEAMLSRAHHMSDAIPFGQPILIGHHSEGRHRRDIDRIDSLHRRGFGAMDEAKDMERRAASAEDSDAISSDAPDAVERLEAKLAKMEETRAKFKAINKAIRANDDAALRALGLKDETIAKLKAPTESWLRPGIQQYELTNLGANVRRVEQRIAHLKALAARAAAAPVVETVLSVPITTDAPSAEAQGAAPTVAIIDNAEANRTQVRFPGKPSAECRADLKANGFRWSPSEGVWQRHLSNGARYHAERIAAKHYGVDLGKPASAAGA